MIGLAGSVLVLTAGAAFGVVAVFDSAQGSQSVTCDASIAEPPAWCRFASYSEQSSATVLDVDKEGDRSDTPTTQIDVAFDAAHQHVVTSIEWDAAVDGTLPKVGANVLLAYDPNDPEVAVASSERVVQARGNEARTVKGQAVDSTQTARSRTEGLWAAGLILAGLFGVLLTFLWARRAPRPSTVPLAPAEQPVGPEPQPPADPTNPWRRPT